jgi:hypothetical protein
MLAQIDNDKKSSEYKENSIPITDAKKSIHRRIKNTKYSAFFCFIKALGLYNQSSKTIRSSIVTPSAYIYYLLYYITSWQIIQGKAVDIINTKCCISSSRRRTHAGT